MFQSRPAFPIPTVTATGTARPVPQTPEAQPSVIELAVAALCRPRLLVAAARAGRRDYRRSRDLPRILRRPDLPDARTALAQLLALEAAADAARRARDPGYSLLRHVELLIALAAEAALPLPAPG